MTDLTKLAKQARRALIAAGETTANLTNEQLVQLAQEKQLMPNQQPKKEEEQPAMPQPQPQPQPTPDVNAALAQLMQALQPQQQPQLDEQRIVELIKEHATQTVVVKHYDKPETKEIPRTHKAFDKTLKLLTLAKATNVWPYLRGPAGSGKTTLAAQLAEALDVPFFDTASVNDKFELIGFVNATGTYQETPFYKAFKTGGVFLFDEKDGSAPEAVLAFNMALANGVYTFPNGERVEQHKHCYFIAGGNTFGKGATAEYSARELLDGATRNRYIEIVIDYDLDLERDLAHATAKAINQDYNAKDVDAFLDLIQKARKLSKEAQLDAIISPRQAIQAGAMLADGFTQEETKQMLFASDFSQAQIESLGV